VTSRRKRGAGNVTRIEITRKAYGILLGKPLGNGRPKDGRILRRALVRKL
jgi:hypothetical protein